MKVGYLDALLKEYDDPIAHFEALAKKMTEEEKEKEAPMASFIMVECTSKSTTEEIKQRFDNDVELKIRPAINNWRGLAIELITHPPYR